MVIHTLIKYFGAIGLCLFLLANANAQSGGEVGLQFGGGYYMGEYNTAGHFRHLSPYVGGFYRYNLSNGLSFRLQAGYSELKIKYKTWPFPVEMPAELKQNIWDVVAVGEYHLRNLSDVQQGVRWSPYLLAGVGMVVAEKRCSLALPFGAGIKYRLSERFLLGVEYGCRKVFSDRLDGAKDVWQTGTDDWFHQDWLHLLHLGVSYRFPDKKCYRR